MKERNVLYLWGLEKIDIFSNCDIFVSVSWDTKGMIRAALKA